MKLNVIQYEDIFDESKVVTSAEIVKDKKFNEEGLFSETIFGNEKDPNNLDTLGWIDLGDYYIVNPIFFERLKKVFKKDYFLKIIQFNKRVDKNGNIIFDYQNDEENRTDLGENIYIGLIEFRKRFEELISLYGNKNLYEYKFIMKNYKEGKLFINKIPIINTKLRPGELFGAGGKGKELKIFLSELNTSYNIIINHSNLLKEIEGDNNLEDVKIQQLPLLYRIQLESYDLAKELISAIKSKHGIIRKLMMGSRVNYSARNVIIPNPNLKMDEVELNYITFLELYKYYLVNLVSISEGIDLVKAFNYIQSCRTKFDEKLYRYMMELVNNTKFHMHIILNRNPSINIGSIMQLKIKNIKKDIGNLTLSLPNSILVPFGADYDGDVLNIIALFTNKQSKDFIDFVPQNLLISSNDGKFNTEFSLQKDQKLAVYLLNN